MRVKSKNTITVGFGEMSERSKSKNVGVKPVLNQGSNPGYFFSYIMLKIALLNLHHLLKLFVLCVNVEMNSTDQENCDNRWMASARTVFKKIN